MEKKSKVLNTSIVLLYLGLLLGSCTSEENEPIDLTIKEEETGEEGNEKAVSCPDSTYSHQLPIAETVFDSTGYSLVWEDNFDYPDSQLDERWTSQNGPSGHIECSRWRENAVVSNGVLELKAIKENRGGQEWTCGNIWTNEAFKYGYFESRYKYAGATGTNNSFWLFSRTVPHTGPVLTCELDANEGHFPNEINTNRHHWQNGNTENVPQPYTEGLSPAYAHTFQDTLKTKMIRFSSNYHSHFHIREFRIYEPNENCYPESLLSATADSDVEGLVNLALGEGVTITSSGIFDDRFPLQRATDGDPSTSWVTQRNGAKWLQFEWENEQEIGHIQFINGWQSNNDWNALITDYKIEAFIDGNWIEVGSYDVLDNYNYADQYHLYGMEWTEEKVDFYFNRRLIRSIPNTECFSPLSVWLSLAIFDTAGEVTDAIDGTSMKIDWVRVYQKD